MYDFVDIYKIKEYLNSYVQKTIAIFILQILMISKMIYNTKKQWLLIRLLLVTVKLEILKMCDNFLL